MTGAELAAAKLRIGEDSSRGRKYFSMSEKYAAFRDFRVDPRGEGLHGLRIPPGEVIRLTDAEVLSHPLNQGFGPFAAAYPPMRGWLATSVCSDDGRRHGMLQLSDKSSRRDFDESDEANIHELAALIGETLDARRLAARRPAWLIEVLVTDAAPPAAFVPGDLAQGTCSRGFTVYPEAPERYIVDISSRPDQGPASGRSS
ncbi:GAF domain-containing protein [Agromyces sp. NPDC004153]